MRYVRRFAACTVLSLLFIVTSCSNGSSQGGSSDEVGGLLPGANELSGLTLKDSLRIYPRNTVWDYFSSYAETELNNGLDKLATATYSSGGNSLTIDVIHYREPINAFTMYSLYRRPDAEFFDIPFESHIYADTLRLLKGDYVARIVRQGDVPKETMVEAARLIANKIVDTTQIVPPVFARFPQENVIPHSEAVRVRDQLSYLEFPNFYSRKYTAGSDTLSLYIMSTTNGLPIATEEFIGQDGKVDEWLMTGQYHSLVGHHPNRGNVYCAFKDETLVVVTGFTNQKDAQALVEEAFKNFVRL